MTLALRILAALALVALVCIANELSYRDAKLQEAMLTERAQSQFYTPYGEAECRRPVPVTEMRVYTEWCSEAKKCWRSCWIKPRDPDASRQANRKRVMTRS
jgi:hypothetical protein